MWASRIECCNKTAIGGFLRNKKGVIDMAFSKLIDDELILTVECMTISMRVRLARIKKIRSIKVKNDAIQVIKTII